MSPDDRARLSPGERALWFLQRFAPASPAYNLAGALRVAGLDAAALGRALSRLADRHPALRTAYPAASSDSIASLNDAEPRREVAAEPAIADIVAVAAAADAADLCARLAAEANRPFDPERGPLWRVRVFADEQVVLFVFHHLIADFASLAVILAELGELYGEAAGGAPARLPPPPAPYAAWVARQERELAGGRGDRLRAFWQERLGGRLAAAAEPVLHLPADRPRPPRPSGAGDARGARLDRAATARLLALARARGGTLFTVLLAGFQLLLERTTGDPEVWIGAPAVDRAAARWLRTVGYFANTVVLRSRRDGEPPFAVRVDRAGEEAAGALAHRDWPFPLLVEQLQPGRDPARPPLVQAMLVVHRTRRPEE